jgi:hypothetical protein
MTRHALLTYAAKHWPTWQFRLMCGLVWLEAGLRSWGARRGGQSSAAKLFGTLRALAVDLFRGRAGAARERVRRAARHLPDHAAAWDGKR